MSKKLLSYLLMCLSFFIIVSCSESMKKSDMVYFQNPNNSMREKYLLGSKDIVNISVFDVPKLSKKVRVSDEGVLSYPLVRDIKVDGLTTREVEKVLEERLKDGYVKNPEVTVTLNSDLMESSKEKEVFVIGEVNNQGTIPMNGRHLSLIKAVAKSGGFTKVAAPQRTKIVRVVDGEEKSIIVDLKNLKKGNQSLNFILQPGDVVIIPQSHF